MTKKVTKKLSASHSSKSLALHKFGLRHAEEIRSFWYHQVMSVYAQRWLTEHGTDFSGGISTYPGDAATPFRNMAYTPSQVIALIPRQLQILSHSHIIRLVTIFENFLYDCIQRVVYLFPEVMDKSGLKVDLKDLIGVANSSDVRSWLAHYVADKICRSKTPKQLIEWVDEALQAGVTGRLVSEIEEWRKWTLVRNSIAHLGGDVSAELALEWSDRFPTKGSPIQVSEKELLRLAFVSRKLAKSLDAGQRALRSRKSDRDLIAREIFIGLGTIVPSELSFATSAILSVDLNKNDAEALIARIRKGQMNDEGVVITQDMLRGSII